MSVSADPFLSPLFPGIAGTVLSLSFVLPKGRISARMNISWQGWAPYTRLKELIILTILLLSSAVSRDPWRCHMP